MSATCLGQAGVEATVFIPQCSTQVSRLASAVLFQITSLGGQGSVYFFFKTAITTCLKVAEDSRSSFKLALYESCSLLSHING